ncbi:hypothetical protein [Synechocystis sp. FACHB-383]|uniref:hypothetical protein n=1 Tax=Synechocystis sp. FACHB-383 TaxID=2692864 RepID=UPI0018EFDC41|nr:hypothetical protein [Synechocystis sp. FACHB-383]
MPQHLQWQVVKFVQRLKETQIQGTPGQQLLHFASSINAEDIQLMCQVIKQDCGQIDVDQW